MRAAFFTANRQTLGVSLGQRLSINIAGYSSLQQQADMAQPFYQEANFWYLTGIDAPGWQLIIDSKRSKSWLVAPEVDAVHALFDGSLAHEQAIARSGVDGVLSRLEADQLLARISARDGGACYTLGRDPQASHYDFIQNPAPATMRRQLGKQFTSLRDCRLELSRLRAIKQPEELRAIQRAIDLTVDTFAKVKEALPGLRYEYEVEAEFSYHFRRQGAHGHAYAPIVASGAHACTLHYGENNGPLGAGEVLLLDVGARVEGYAADISRSYAIGAPSQRIQTIHAALAGAHQEIISLLRPGLRVADYHQQVDEIMKQELRQLGLISSSTDERGYRRYFPHAISHGLGIDVHDSLGRPEVFQPGMVLTVEPGIYIPEESIGLRIEDNVVITAEGNRNLSARLSTGL